MGNCLSANNTISIRDLVTRPGTTEQQMTADTINQGLTAIASAAKHLNVSVIAVGGAVNTLYLRTRPSTGDVDFFYHTKTRHEDVMQLILVADSARKKLRHLATCRRRHSLCEQRFDHSVWDRMTW
jgi:hypothetical protein